ncbi:hypothetical protein S83_055220, partial [Arachis hypogaea]
ISNALLYDITFNEFYYLLIDENCFKFASTPKLVFLYIEKVEASLNVKNISHYTSKEELVHYVFNPALVEGNLADTITFENFVTLEHSHYIYNRVNFGMDPSQNHKGSQKPRRFDNWCLFCRHRNLENLPIIIIPAICKDKGSPFGDPDVYYTYGMIGSVYIWSYVYNIMRVSASKFHRESTASIHSIHSIHAYIYRDRGSLATRVIKYYNKLNQKMPLIYVKLYTYQIFRALSYIHRCIGVCHCDINPQNLLLDTLTSDISNMNDVLLAKPAGLKKVNIHVVRFDMGYHTPEKITKYDWRRDMLGLATPRNGSILQAEVLRQDSLLVSLFHSLPKFWNLESE